jgi:hypothetical protein
MIESEMYREVLTNLGISINFSITFDVKLREISIYIVISIYMTQALVSMQRTRLSRFVDFAIIYYSYLRPVLLQNSGHPIFPLQKVVQSDFHVYQDA